MREQILQVMKEGAKIAREKKEIFVKNEVAIGRHDPEGLKKYAEGRIFELKKKAKEENLIGSAWVNGGCVDIYDKEVLTEIRDLLVKTFTMIRKRQDRYIEKGFIESYSDNEIIEHWIKPETHSFFVVFEQIDGLSWLDIPGSLIIDAKDILTIQKGYSGLLWVEGIPEVEFLNYWRRGNKSRYLPLGTNKINSFVYLLLLLKIAPDTSDGEINKLDGVSYKVLEDTFHIADMKSKKSKIVKKVKETPGSYRQIKTIFNSLKTSLEVCR